MKLYLFRAQLKRALETEFKRLAEIVKKPSSALILLRSLPYIFFLSDLKPQVEFSKLDRQLSLQKLGDIIKKDQEG